MGKALPPTSRCITFGIGARSERTADNSIIAALLRKKFWTTTFWRGRYRERILLKACLEAKQPFVLDNTNLTREARAETIAQARAAGFGVTGYYFQSSLAAAIERNLQRSGKAQIPLKGLLTAHRKLEVPSLDEGFDQLHYVQIGDDVQFVVKEWNDEIR